MEIPDALKKAIEHEHRHRECGIDVCPMIINTKERDEVSIYANKHFYIPKLPYNWKKLTFMGVDLHVID